MVHIMLTKAPYIHTATEWSTRNGSISTSGGSEIKTNGGTFESILRDLAVCLIWAIDADDVNGKRIASQLIEEVLANMGRGTADAKRTSRQTRTHRPGLHRQRCH